MEKLITQLQALLKNSYVPYSHVHVAAIAIDETGNWYTGVNVENSVFPAGICAERTAIFKAVSEIGPAMRLQEIHIISSLEKLLPPCGMCLQVMAEFMAPDAKIFLHDKNNKLMKAYTLGQLLPSAVTKDSFNFKNE